MGRDRHYRLFDRIAFMYSWFFTAQSRWYDTIISTHNHLIKDNHTFLDVGCGTGAFGYALRDRGYEVTGVDGALAMVRYGAKKGLRCVVGDILAGLPFRDKSFDALAVAFVAHGFGPEDRALLYRECGRLARNVVLFHDFNMKKRFFIGLVERLEGSDYHNFIRSVPGEMEACFSSVSVIEAGPVNNWYLCRPY